MKLILIISFALLSLSGWAQTISEQKIKAKIKEGLNYVLDEQQNNPEDLLIVVSKNSNSFYMVCGTDSVSFITKEVTPPDLASVSENLTMISKDSVIDFIWVKGKTFQTLIMGNSQIPFKKIKKRFLCEIIGSLQTEISVLNEQKYFEELVLKHGDLIIYKSTDINKVITKITLNQNISMPELMVNYPFAARENKVSGVTRIGFVITNNGTINDLHVFQRLGSGCTESLISTVSNMSNLLKQKGYNNASTYYIELTISFTLIG